MVMMTDIEEELASFYRHLAVRERTRGFQNWWKWIEYRTRVSLSAIVSYL
jgi:tRNA isopentenyl-2-thiomethyl-A-37 hydroxylase MiaE